MAANRDARAPSTCGSSRGGRALIRRLLAGMAVALTTVGITTMPAAHATPSGALRIIVLSANPMWVSGPTALIAVTVPTHADLRHVDVTLDDRPVTSSLRSDRLQGLLRGVPEPGLLGLNLAVPTLVGLVELSPGRHVLQASLPDGHRTQTTITDYPAHGPMFAGPQVQPWHCNDGSTSADCAVATRYAYYYVPRGAAGLGNQFSVGSPPVANEFMPYNTAKPPSRSAIATATSDQGVTVPFVIRVETGVLDRGTYQIGVLATPGKSWKPWHSPPAWNHKVDVEVGGNCRAWHDQTPGLPVFDEHALARGYAVMTSGLDILGNDCNPVVAAESLAMTKARLIDEYGLVRFTIGEGCSGGSIILNAVTSNYPGLVDGLMLMCSFPDIWQVTQQAEDCHVLDRVFDLHPLRWPLPAQDDVTGYLEPTTCRSLFDGPQSGFTTGVPDYARSMFDPGNASNCTAEINPPWVYNASTNPGGVRCTLQDYQQAIWGQRPRSVWTEAEKRIGHGFANRPYDNVGVQYGLVALNHHEISVDQFLSLNREVGGIDINWAHTAARSVADHHALEVAYRTGQILDPRAQAGVPIIDLRGHDNEEIHLDIDSYVERARLDQVNGGHRNEALWLELGDYEQDPAVAGRAFDDLDAWLSAVQRDRQHGSLVQKVEANRPPTAVDSCWTGEQQVTLWSKCQKVYVHGTDPRLAAGGPPQDNLLKCRLTAPRRSRYVPRFSAAQWQELNSVFPDGVCNDAVPGIGQRPSVPWTSFS